MKKFISGLIVGVLLAGTVSFAANLSAVKSVFKTTVNGKAVTQNVVAINGAYYADLRQLAGNLGIKYAIDTKGKKITLGEASKTAVIAFSNETLSIDSMGVTTVNAEAKNNDAKEHTFIFKVTMTQIRKL